MPATDGRTVTGHLRLLRDVVGRRLPERRSLLLLLWCRPATKDAATGGACREKAERVDLGDGETVERVRIGSAQREDGVGPVFARALGDVGAVVEGHVRRRLSVGRGSVQIIVRLPSDAGHHCNVSLA